MRNWLILLIVIIVAVFGGYTYIQHHAKPPVGFRTAKVTRGDLLATIGATGTVEPQEVVDVGAQIAGQINTFGNDPHQPGKLIDYGSEVEEGTVLAIIDDSLYAADVASAQAQVEQGKANVQKAQADLGQLKAKLNQASNDWKRAQEAGARAGLSESDIDSYKANYEIAVANLADGDAAVLQAQTGQAQAQAQLDRSKRNLSYCTITSPVKGTIIDRRVNIGQTVVSSLNAPSLFLIAKDLKRIQVWASVNEADIGSIHSGQPATFTVDAFPNRVFTGTVGKVRLNATMTQNVVTYTVEIETDNSDGKLLPYLTANVKFQIDKRTNVLIVPNAALRWIPQPNQLAPEARSAVPAAGPPSETGESQEHGTLWVVDGNFVRPLPVHVGLTDGLDTEVDARDLSEATSIVVGDADAPDMSGGGGANPFVPQFGKRRTK